jgi:hypothetical protein
MRDRAELLGALLAIERSMPVEHLQVDGAPLWPLIRIVAGSRAVLPQMQRPSQPSKRSHWQVLVLMFRGWLQELAIARHPRGRLLFFSDRIYQAQTAKGWVDRFAEPLIDPARASGKDSLLLVRTKRHNAELMHRDGLHIQDIGRMLALKDLVHWRKRRVPFSSLPFGTEIGRSIAHSLGDDVADHLGKAVHSYRMHLRTYRKLITSLRPEHTFVTCWYTIENMAVAQACHEHGIPCTDLQHGVQGQAHLAYGHWVTEKVHSWTCMPSSFWCWDEASAQHIRSWAGTEGPKVFEGGSPWFEAKHGNVDTVDVQDRCILFTMQPVDRPIPDHLAEVIRHTDQQEKWVFRCHPSTERHAEIVRYWAAREHLSDRVCVEMPATVPLSRSLARARIHITLYSSVILEAAMMGIPSIALDPYARSIYPELVDQGLVIQAHSVSELLKGLELERQVQSGNTERPDLGKRLSRLLEVDNGREK